MNLTETDAIITEEQRRKRLLKVIGKFTLKQLEQMGLAFCREIKQCNDENTACPFSLQGRKCAVRDC